MGPDTSGANPSGGEGAAVGRHRSGVTALVVAAAVALPWLNPAAGGPSAVMQPWLIAAASTLFLWLLVLPRTTAWELGLATAVAVVLGAVGGAAPPVLLAVGGLAVIAVSAGVCRAAAQERWLLAAVVNGLLAASLASSAFALVQYFGLSPNAAPVVNPTEAGEAFANLRQRNQFASLTSIGLCALFWKMQSAARMSWILPSAVLLAAANAASASRTGAFQVVLVVAMVIWWRRLLDRRVLALCITVVAGYCLAALLLPILLQAWTGVSASNAFRRLAAADGCSSRAILWSNVLHLIAQKPAWGWGWGELDYAHFATLYPGARFCDILDNAHNLPLHLAVELGLPAAFLACAGSVTWLARRKPWRETDAMRQMAWMVVAVILFHSLLEYPLWYGPFQMAFGLGLGVLASAPATPGQDIGSRSKRIVGALLASALLFAAWDYQRVSQLYTAPGERSRLFGERVPQVGDSWLFRDQLAFAELSVVPLTQENAAQMHALALDLLHYSPEPRVVEEAIQSAMSLHREAEALWLMARYRAAFPVDYERWLKAAGLGRLPAATQPPPGSER